LLRFLCTYNKSADCVRSARTHHIPSHPIPSHHILYILVLELERTFFSSSFSHSIVRFCVSSEIWSFLMLSKSQFDGNNLSGARVAKSQLHFL
jgi:hypothetical protein